MDGTASSTIRTGDDYPNELSPYDWHERLANSRLELCVSELARNGREQVAITEELPIERGVGRQVKVTQAFVVQAM